MKIPNVDIAIPMNLRGMFLTPEIPYHIPSYRSRACTEECGIDVRKNDCFDWHVTICTTTYCKDCPELAFKVSVITLQTSMLLCLEYLYITMSALKTTEIKPLEECFLNIDLGFITRIYAQKYLLHRDPSYYFKPCYVKHEDSAYVVTNVYIKREDMNSEERFVCSGVNLS